MDESLIGLIDAVGDALPADGDDAVLALSALRRAVSRARRDHAATVAENERLRNLLRRTPALLLADGIEDAASVALDGLIAALGARRGLVGVLDDDGGWRVVVARDLEESDLSKPETQVSTGLIDKALASGETVIESDAGRGAFAQQASVNALRLRSVLCMPFESGDVRGFLYVDNSRVRGAFEKGAVEAVKAWLPVVASGLSRSAAPADSDPFERYLTRSAPLLARLGELKRLAGFDVSIVLLGETGTGKSVLARCIHDASPRRAGPFVHINCGAIPEALIEAELFGSVKGAFTGSVDREGKFQSAKGGTIFLDELNSMPAACQVKLLVALQELQVTPLGANDPVSIDVRVIAALNHQQTGTEIREDLYFRLAVFSLEIPPLRERPEDIALLAAGILARASKRHRIPPPRMGSEALQTLISHSWPGNVRELENTLDRAALLALDGAIETIQLARGVPRRTPTAVVTAPAEVASSRAGKSVPQAEFLEAWRATEGNAVQTAKRLGIRERSVYRLKKKYL